MKQHPLLYNMVMGKTIIAEADPDDVYDKYGRFLGNIRMEDGKVVLMKNLKL